MKKRGKRVRSQMVLISDSDPQQFNQLRNLKATDQTF